MREENRKDGKRGAYCRPQACCFEYMVCDLRSIIRVAQGRQGQPSAVILDCRTIQSTCERGPHAGYDGY